MIKKIAISMIIFILLFNVSMNVHALEITQASLVKIGTADYHLKYYREDRGNSSYVICSIVGYNNQNKFYPAYCMNKDLPGAESGEYTVNINEILNNPAVWRVVTNGYPYLEPHQMGLTTEYDAYAVTKMAIYCIIGQSKLEYYSAYESDPVRMSHGKCFKIFS